MELSLESDAEALWQDSLDLLTGEGAPAALLAMLQKCSPVQLEDGVLQVETPMRMVAKSVAKNAAVIEACLEQAAFEPVRLDVQFRQGAAVAAAPAPAPAPAPVPAVPEPAAAMPFSPANKPAPELQAERPRGHVLMGAAGSVMTPEELRRWDAAVSGTPAALASPAEADAWDEESEAQAHERLARERREKNPLADEEVAADSKLTFDRFVMGD